MRVFVTGASGAIGSRLVPQLIEAGHEVTGTHNSPASAELLRTLGAKPVMVDLLDARAMRKAVLESEPEAIVHQATALANANSGATSTRRLPRPTSCGRRAPTRCSRPRERHEFVDSSRRAPSTTGTPGREDRSRPKTIRSTQRHRRTRSRRSPP